MEMEQLLNEMHILSLAQMFLIFLMKIKSQTFIYTTILN